MPKSVLNWKVAGSAGEGIKTTGLLFSKACLRHGLYTFDYTEYPSLIRGGHNTYQVTAGQDKIYSQEAEIDVLVALNVNGLKLHQSELTPDSLVLFDNTDHKQDLSQYDLPGTLYDVPLVQLAIDSGGERVMANNVALGVSVFLLNLDIAILDQVIDSVFGGKGEQIVGLNQKAARAGYEYASQNLKPHADIHLQKASITEDISLTGNEAIALGLIAGGLKAYIAYPMTPSSSILHSLADWQEKANILVKHAEDEIGVINMALGASFAGVRTAVGTSGGGFAYMTEAVGLSGVAELPLVIIESMRPGPALGMPTWTAQADLLFVINASQDEFPRVVMAPGDVTEAFILSKLSLELAESYQIPVIVLSDKHLSEGAMSAHFPQTVYNHRQTSITTKPTLDENGMFHRYHPTETGLSFRTIPGIKNGKYIANSYEHDYYGYASEESKDRITQMDKRFKKMEQLITHIPNQYHEGPENADVTLVGFGSTKTVLQAAAQKLNHQGINTQVLNLSWLWPFPSAQVASVLNQAKTPIIFEGNKTYQLSKLIRQETGIDIYHKRQKYDGRPFYPSEIVGWVKEIIKS
jgi:2-oxoglutarate/2-oxoacid ferredoxin oxidoreductase subunit alpha